MARRPRKRKKKNKKQKKAFQNIDKKKIIWPLIIAAVSASIIYGVGHFLNYSDYFRIKQVAVVENGDMKFVSRNFDVGKEFVNRNIFSVNLQHAAKVVAEKTYGVKKVVIEREMPDRLKVIISPRNPLAVIDYGAGIVVDEEGVVLSVGNKYKDIVLIKGISFFVGSPRVGEKVQLKSLDKALKLLSLIKTGGVSDGHRVHSLDITDKRNILLDVDGVVVRLGQSAYRMKIDNLKKIIDDPDVVLAKINYIDLRFDKPVISPK